MVVEGGCAFFVILQILEVGIWLLFENVVFWFLVVCVGFVSHR